MAEITQVKTVGFMAEETLWLTADGKIVRDGDRRAAQLLASKGAIIPEKVAKRLGLAKGIKVESLEAEPKGPAGSVMGGFHVLKTISPEAIRARSTRPEEAPEKR